MSHSDRLLLHKVTNEILKDPECCPENIKDAVNWADLCCTDVEEIIDLSERKYYRVIIEEASPEAVKLVNFVDKKLAERGFKNVYAKCEW